MATEQQNLSRWKASGSPLEWVRERDGDWDHDDWTTLLSMLQRGKYWPMRPDEVGRLLEEVRDAHFPPDGDWALHPNQPRHRVTLTCELSRGGEGAVWETDDPAVLVKVYFKTPSEQHVEKLRHMVEHPPKDPERSSGHVSIAWPQALFARDGQVIGFTMPRGVGAVDLQHVMTPKWRDRQFPDATFALPLLLAYNLSLAVERTHAGGYVLGDIKPQNILCNPEGKVTLIDCDSAQVDTGRGRVFPASACTPEYTPPELINARTLATLKPDQDNFSLAVLLFQLLSVVNAHPFQGRWSGAESDRPSTPEEGIARGYYVLDASNAMQPPGVLKLAEVLPESTLKMFSQAFINGHSQPASRPAAGYWRAEMFSLIQQTRQLDRRCHNGNPRHVFPKPGPCPWCNSKSKLFGPYVENSTAQEPTENLAGGRRVNSSPHNSRNSATITSRFVAGEVQLPFDCIMLMILHDQETAIVAGVKGEIAAISLRNGDVQAIVKAHEKMGRSGGGENHYVRDVFFFLELAKDPNHFYTMGVSGNLKTWRFDGTLHLVSTSRLLEDNFDPLHNCIAQAASKGNSWFGPYWSTWTCYNREVPDSVPSGIIEAKLSPDGNSILCLTNWFAIFLCDLKGRLRKSPISIGDTFAIEPANTDSSEFWIGRSRSAGMGETLHRTGFVSTRGDAISTKVQRSSFGNRATLTLTPEILCAGGEPIDTSTLKSIETSDLSFYGCQAPSVLADTRQLVAPSGSMIKVYDLDTLREQGERMIAGHEWDVIDAAVTYDRLHAVSISEKSLRVWDFQARQPVDGYANADKVLRHGIQGNYGPIIETCGGTILYPGYGGSAALIDINKKSCHRISTDIEFLGATDDAGGRRLRALSLSQRKIAPPAKSRGILQKLLAPNPDDIFQYLLVQHEVHDRGVNQVSEHILGDQTTYLGGWCTPGSQSSVAVDLGNCRIALLIAGHLAIYNAKSGGFEKGPLDISGPGSKEKARDTSWTYYHQMVASPDLSKLFIRGDGLPIRVYDSQHLRLIATLFGTEGRTRSLIPWIDSRHILYSCQTRIGDRYSSDKRDVLAIADSSSERVLGKLCDFPNATYNDGGVPTIVMNGQAIAERGWRGEVWLRNLVFDEDAVQIGSHADSVGGIFSCSNGREFMTLSKDGTARYWNTTGHLKKTFTGHDLTSHVLSRVVPIPEETIVRD